MAIRATTRDGCAAMTDEATEMNWNGTLVMSIRAEKDGFGILDRQKIVAKNLDMDQAMLLVDSLRKGLTLTTADHEVECKFTAVLTF